jgi:hypothetical protein
MVAGEVSEALTGTRVRTAKCRIEGATPFRLKPYRAPGPRYTFGYEGQEFEAFITRLPQIGVLTIIDVR